METINEGLFELLEHPNLATQFLTFQQLLTDLHGMPSTPNDMLYAENWLLIGEVYEAIGAPLKAIKCFQKALQINKTLATADHHLAKCYQLIGEYHKAFEAIQAAIEKVPNNLDFHTDRQSIQDCINYDTEAIFKENSITWRLDELLANEQFEAVIEELQTTEDIDLLLYLNRAYGATKQTQNYLSTWEKIIGLQESIDLELTDWFYMPSAIFEEAKIWQLLKKGNELLEDSEFMFVDELEEYLEGKTEKELRLMVCDYHIFKATNDKEGIKKLIDMNPVLEEILE